MSDSPTNPSRIAVIGGGLSGLSAAHRLLELAATRKQPLKLTLFEAGPRAGGVIGTRDIDGYRVELGADSFITNKPWAVDLCRRLGLEDRLIPTDERYRRSLVLRKGRPVEVPEGFQLMTPAQVWPVLVSPIFSPWGKLRMGCEYFVPRRTGGDDESLAHFVRRRFGQEVLERLVQPLVGGIYTSDPEKLSLQATMPRFLEMERDYRSLIRASRRQARSAKQREQASGARYGLFATLAGGVSELLDALTARVSRDATIRLETPVAEISPHSSGGGYSVRLGDGSTSEFDAVILALPAPRAAELVKAFAPDMAKLLQRIEYASSAIVVSGHSLDDVRHPLDAFGLVIPAIEERRILAVSFTSRKFPGRAPAGCVQLRTFVGGAMQPELLQHSDEELKQIVQDELADLLGVSGTPHFSLVARYERAMPQYHVGHVQLVEQIEHAASQHAGFALAGNAYHGVGIPDCIHSGEQAAERICGNATGR